MTPRARGVAVRAAGLACSLLYAGAIVSVYARQPRTVAQLTGGLASSVGAYRVDERQFQEGLEYFRTDRFPEARAAFQRADPAERDGRTQFYVAYSYFREGWGRFYDDDALFAKGLEAVERAIARSPDGRVMVDDPNLGLRSADELKAELERGLRHDASDLDPRAVLRRRP